MRLKIEVISLDIILCADKNGGISMAVNKDTVIRINLSEEDLSKCTENAQILCETISDRSDLHLRSYMERYINIWC